MAKSKPTSKPSPDFPAKPATEAADADVLSDDEAAQIISRFVRYAALVKSGKATNSVVTRLFTQAPLTQKGKSSSRRRRSVVKKASEFRQSVYEGEELCSGYLGTTADSSFTKYQQRFFVLTTHYLKYYVDMKKTDLKGVINLDNMHQVRKGIVKKAGAATDAEQEDEEGEEEEEEEQTDAKQAKPAFFTLMMIGSAPVNTSHYTITT